MEQGLDSFVSTLRRNLAENALEADFSFMDFLHERQQWNEAEYWKLEYALAGISSADYCASDLRDEIDCAAMRIFSYVMASLAWNFDPHDSFRIKNLTDEEARNWMERVRCVFEGLACRNFPPQDIFETRNPLIAALPEAARQDG